MKITLKTTFLLCFFIAFVSVIQAQKLERQLISSYGNLSTTIEGQVAATGGELIITTISTSTITVTQGFQQANKEDFVGIFEESDLALEIRVYPNPSYSKVNIEIDSDILLDVNFDLFDVMGQKIVNKKITVLGSISESIDFSGYATGQYFLIFKDEKNKLIKTIEIQKL